MAQSSTKEYQAMPKLIDVKRNPYLLDYEEQRRLREVTGQATGRRRVSSQGRTGIPHLEEGVAIHRRSGEAVGEGRNRYRQENTGRRPVREAQPMYTDRPDRSVPGRSQGQSVRPIYNGRPSRHAPERGRTSARQSVYMEDRVRGRQSGPARYPEQPDIPVQARRPVQTRRRQPEQIPVRADRGQGNPYRDHARAAVASRQRRKKKVMYQRLAVGIWTMCICLLAVVFFFWNGNASAAEPGNQKVQDNPPVQEPAGEPESEIMVQGLPATEFAKHPDWTENFLTPNEYSRPGDPLTKVTNIFVHYTANPGTSAAQNRSYFEQQKDTHERSVSSHFIIGYEGEVLQCVPLDEIAYAVATRNEDSISIECCFTAEDGSFTQETYDSLISLLAWLTEVYDLEPEDILRHYDCGGKKCPLYYTNHPDSWEKLKEDVAQARGL